MLGSFSGSATRNETAQVELRSGRVETPAANASATSAAAFAAAAAATGSSSASSPSVPPAPPPPPLSFFRLFCPFFFAFLFASNEDQ